MTDTTYATIADLADYAADTIPDLPAQAVTQRLLNNSARDVDWAVGAFPLMDTTTGAKFIPAALPGYQQVALNRATCAQAEYRSLQGEPFMAKAQHQAVRFESTSGAEFRAGELPYIGPKVWRELEVAGLLRRSQGKGLVSVSVGPGGPVFVDQIANL